MRVKRNLGTNRTLWERQPIVMMHYRVVAGNDRLVHINVCDFTHIIGQSFQIVAIEQLFVCVYILFAADVLGHIVLNAVHPDWEVMICYEIERVQTDILKEIA